MSTYIFESKRIESILDFIDNNTFFIFDIDHTLIETSQVIGSTHWQKHLVRRLIDQGLARVDAEKQAQALWKQIQHQSPVRIVEEAISGLIAYLKARKVPILGLTSRDVEIVDLTFKQLASVELHDIFDVQSPCYSFDIDPVCHFSKGALFCGDNRKDVGLKLLMDHLDFKPKKIVFIDDQKSHLYELEEMAYASGIQYVGMHYTASSHERFNYDIARIQEQHLPKILSDHEALKLLGKDL